MSGLTLRFHSFCKEPTEVDFAEQRNDALNRISPAAEGEMERAQHLTAPGLPQKAIQQLSNAALELEAFDVSKGKLQCRSGSA